MPACRSKTFSGTMGVGALIASALASVALAAPIPQSMRAIRTDPDRAPGAVKLQTVPVPQPAGAGAAARLCGGHESRRLDHPGPAPAGGPRPAHPATGPRCSGVIVALGSGVSDYKVGDKVYTALAGGGAFAEYAVAPAAELAMKPQKFTFEEAAGIPIAGYTGLRMVVMANLKPGQRVLVIGAAGGVGSTAVQAARAAGASCHRGRLLAPRQVSAGSGRTGNHRLRQGLVAEKAKAIAVVLNTVGTENANALNYVQPGGLVLDASGQVDEKACAAAKVTCIHVQRQGPTNAELLKRLTQMADAGSTP